MKGFIRTAITYEDTPEWQELWKAARMLALKDGWSLSKLMREALTEYVKRHDPGNPQLALIHWQNNQPLPETLREVREVKPEPDPMEGLRALPTEDLIRQLAKIEKTDRRTEYRVSIEMLLQWNASNA